ncbi:receptor-type tyrosine-protein phosphatase F-like [Stylophora pistillata]|uniref:receptor-type tyrosine-protein phosphatase F-like n=1 Tax=Stylophora pistillata TaxID=50429 RepID=UPI000C04B0F6|nr:receptor-type tyrosine-protein phosphatase F-like [Stylophora pistillata]
MLEKLVPKKDGSCLPSHAECCSTVLLEGERNTNLKAVGILNFEVNEQQLTFHPVWFKKSRVEDILGLPEKPTIQDDKDEKDVKFTLTWLAPNTKFTNVSPEYRVELWKKHLTGSSKLCQQGRTDGTQFKTTDLEYNSEYEVKLFTVNKHGESEQEVVTFKTNTGFPEKPVIPKDKYEKDVGFTLTWLAPNTSCNDVSPEYRVELWKKHLTGSSKLCRKGSTDGTQFKITDLEYNSEYEVKLFAVNKHGESEPEVITFKTKTGLPEKPTIQKVKGEVDVNFTLTWLAPNTSCSDVSPKFRLEWKKKHLTGSSKLFQQGNIDETHFQFTNLEYNSEYEGKLFPFNKHGEGEPEVFTFKTKNGVYLINFN